MSILTGDANDLPMADPKREYVRAGLHIETQSRGAGLPDRVVDVALNGASLKWTRVVVEDDRDGVTHVTLTFIPEFVKRVHV